MDLDTHPNPQPNPHHRRVELQSSHDLTYLQTNLANSALQKLDLHFPKISKPATHISLGGRGSEEREKGKNGLGKRKRKSKSNGVKDGNQEQDGDEAEEEEEEEEEEEDPMRRRVHDLVTAFLMTTWQSAAHNISVNGIDASSLPIPHTVTLSHAPSPPLNHNNVTTTMTQTSTSTPDGLLHQEIEGIDFQYAAFDASLQRKLASLHGEVETLTAQVSKLRRTAPREGSEVYRARLEEVMAADDAEHDEAIKPMVKSKDGQGGKDNQEEEEEEDGDLGLEIETVREGWYEDVREMYEHGLRELAGLAGVGRTAAVAGGTAQQGDRSLGSGGDTIGGDGDGIVAAAAATGSTVTETVGKAQRAIRVAMDLE